MEFFAGWHGLDLFFVALGCFFVIRGCFRGFVGEVVTLAGFICSFYVSFKFSGQIGKILSHGGGLNPSVAQFLAMALIWLFVTLIAAAVRRILKSMLDAADLGGVDKLLGLFSGLFKTCIMIYVFLVGGLLLSPVVNPVWMSNSDVLRYAGRHWPQVRQILVDFDVLPEASELPNGTLEQILRPYRTGSGGPKD
ncbi:MAG: CvpA family protein [Synergistaceae bacterium]|nr:CvpA family protein [Synergistaceae bacterium]